MLELDHVVGHPRDAGIVRRDHEGHAVLGQAADDRQEIFRRAAVELRRRLVGDDDRRPGRQHLRDSSPLLLASGELLGQMVTAVRDPEGLEELLGAGPVRPLRTPRGQPQMLVDGQVGNEVVRGPLEDETDGGATHLAQAPGGHRRQVEAVHQHLSARREIEPRE